MTTPQTPSDQDVRDRIVHDLETSFAVEAGAGTGKTSLLTARILEAVRTGHAKLGEIVAITFTDRAANELKVRLREALETLHAEATGEEAARIVDALAALDAAHVSTIHSFCAELLLERPVEAGVDPGFSITDALQKSILFDEVWEDWLAGQLADERGPLRPAFAAGLHAEALRKFALFLLENPDLRPAEEDAPAVAPALADAFVPLAQELWSRLRERRCPLTCTCYPRVLSAATLADRIDGAHPDDVLPLLPALNVRVQKVQNGCSDAAAKRECKRILGELQDLVDEWKPTAAHALVCGLVRALRGAVEAFETAKRDRALLDFDDLLRKTRDLLRDNKPVREYFQRRFKMILVDECQDTDPLQTEIALYLAEDGARADDWRDVRLAPGKLLFVGDPKQSIYRFRRADIELYAAAREVVARHGKLVTIRQNFRSGRRCVAWVNAVFAELIRRPEDGAYQPDYVPLDAWRDDPGLGVTVLRPPEETVFEHIDEARSAEAAAVADEIREMVRRGDPVLDKATRERRPVRFGDVAVLFRQRTAFETYERALDEAEVPFRAVSGREFFGRQEVAELRAVLTAIERPYDAVAVLAALRTSLLGVSDDELAAAARDGFDYLVADGSGGGPYVREVFALLRRWHEARNATSIPAMVERVLSDTKALELFYLKPGGEQRAANLAKAIDAARTFEGTPGATFGRFTRWLAEMSSIGDEEEAPLDEDDGEHVKLLTIHKSKGLEFPVVVLADLSGQESTGRDPVVGIVDRSTGTLHIKLGREGLGLTTRGFEDAKEAEARRQEAERRRLFYVAATRARDRLLVTAFPRKDKPAAYLKYLEDLAADVAGPWQTEIRTDPSVAAPRPPAAFRIRLPEQPGKEAEALRRQRDRWAAERAKRIERAAGGPRLRTATELVLPAFAGREGEGPPSEAQAVGNAVHAVLERVDLATGRNLAELAADQAAVHDIPDRRDLVEALARTALESEAVQQARRSAAFYREVPFAVNIDGTVVEGVIDLAFRDDDGLHIVDYKTGEAGDDPRAHTATYRLQLGTYALAASEVFGELPRSLRLLFLRTGREVPVEVNEDLLAEVRAAL